MPIKKPCFKTNVPANLSHLLRIIKPWPSCRGPFPHAGGPYPHAGFPGPHAGLDPASSEHGSGPMCA